MSDVVAIVPAAGLSRRFGGPNKLLHPFGDTTVVGAVVRTLCDCNVGVLVVTGRDADLIETAVHPAPCVFNPDFEQGLGTSIACGVREALRGRDGAASKRILIALADMPTLRAEVVQQVIGSGDDSMIVAPVYADEQDRFGHPVLFGSDYAEDLMRLQGDVGARTIIERHRARLKLIRVEGSLEDFDAPP